MAPKKIVLALVVILALGILQFLFAKKEAYNYTFINQSQDHRFDESIRVSILAANNKAHADNAVVILDKLPPDFKNIESYASELFHRLNIGRAYNSRGILYLMLPSLHALKIEVSYSLEPQLPDSSLRLLEEAAKTFIYSDRIHDFWAELLITTNLLLKNSEDKTEKQTSYDLSTFKYLSGGAGRMSTSYVPTKEQLLKEIADLPSASTRYTRSSTDLDEALRIYLDSLSEGIYAINLGILDPDSQLFRLRTPMTLAQLQRNYQMMKKAGVDKTFITKDLAFVFFKPDFPVLPLVFRKNHNREWLIQEALSWSLFHRFEDSDKVFLKYPLKTENNDLSLYLKQKFSLPLFHFAEQIDLEHLDSIKGSWSTDYFFLYDIESFRSRLAQIPLAQRLDLQTNLGLFSEFLKTYKEACDLYPKDNILKKNYQFYKEQLVFKNEDWQLSL